MNARNSADLRLMKSQLQIMINFKEDFEEIHLELTEQNRLVNAQGSLIYDLRDQVKDMAFQMDAFMKMNDEGVFIAESDEEEAANTDPAPEKKEQSVIWISKKMKMRNFFPLVPKLSASTANQMTK